MTDFKIHTMETAPARSRPLLENSLKGFGMIPNLHAVMAESPQTLEAYQTLHSLFQASSLSPVERHVVWLTINVEHACHYCVPAHTGLAHMDKVAPEIIDALREARPLTDPRLEALRTFTLSALRNRGRVDDAQVNAFLEAGFTRAAVLDVVLGLAQKVLSNYVNHFADTPVDTAFAKFGWDANQAQAAE